MTIELANFIYAIIPGVIGLLILVFPNIFIKKEAPKEEVKKLKMVGTVLICVSIIQAAIKIF